MKKITVIFYFVFLIIGQSIAQKPIVDASSYNRWSETLRFDACGLSTDGKYFSSIQTNAKTGSRSFVIESIDKTSKKVYSNIKEGLSSANKKWVIFKTAGDSLCLFEPGKNIAHYISGAKDFRLIEESGACWLAYHLKDHDQLLLLKNLETGKEHKINAVLDYLFKPDLNVLLYTVQEGDSSNRSYPLYHLNINTLEKHLVWNGIEKVNLETVGFGKDGRQLAFLLPQKVDSGEQNKLDNGTVTSYYELWYYSIGMKIARPLINSSTSGVGETMFIKEAKPVFDQRSNSIFFTLAEKQLHADQSGQANVNVWNYKETLPHNIQSSQHENEGFYFGFTARVTIDHPKVTVLEDYNTRLQLNEQGLGNSDHVILNHKVSMGIGTPFESFSHPSWWPSMYLFSLKDGSKKQLLSKIQFPGSWNIKISPAEKYVIYYNPEQKDYFTYEIATGTTRNISHSISVSLINKDVSDRNAGVIGQFGICGWMEGDKALLIYDQYDIWQVDPTGVKKAVNITAGYGRANKIVLRLNKPYPSPIDDKEPSVFLLNASDERTKETGFYRKDFTKPGTPEKLCMGPYHYQSPERVEGTDLWLVNRQSTTEYPNWYVSKNLKTFESLTDVQPQKEFNWMTSELLTWKMKDGKSCQGILYKPENFDPSKKYPVVISYYELHSDGINTYQIPNQSGVADLTSGLTANFVSSGYLVFVPDIYRKVGYPGDGALQSVESGVKYLCKRSYVNSNRLGICGHSFGGFETMYLITHSHLFTAAAEGDGVCDFARAYGDYCPWFCEVQQMAFGKTPWQRPDIYIKNSPFYHADKVSTPLLMLHGKKDQIVDFGQAKEFFTALRRLEKKVWLLEYENGAHGLFGEDAIDYNTRLTQFFDHYLKDAPPPKWMTDGIPEWRKGIDTGLELDTSGKQP